MKLRFIVMTLAVIGSLPAFADYTFQAVLPPGAEDAQGFGLNSSGKVVGPAVGDSGLFSYLYDIKTGAYTIISDTFAALEISNSGVMVGATDNVCTVLNKDGTTTSLFPPSWTDDAICAARGVNADGKVSGYVEDEIGVFTGFIYDPEYGTYEEFLPSPQTIAHAINAQGINAGSVFLFANEAYPGSPQGRYGYVREVDGTVDYFAIDQSLPGRTRARGISENGLVSGFYLDPDTFEHKGFVITLPAGDGFNNIVLDDDEVLHVRPCNPDVPPPPVGYEILTDIFTEQVRNDGVVVGACTDYYSSIDDPDDFIVVSNTGFVATPVK